MLLTVLKCSKLGPIADDTTDAQTSLRIILLQTHLPKNLNTEFCEKNSFLPSNS